MKDLGLFLLGIWLIATGLFDLVDLRFRYDDIVMSALAIVAGGLVMIRR
jgi:hypothetical protein